MSELPPPAARAMMQTLIIHAVCFNQPSHQPRCREQPTIIVSSSIPVLSRLEMPGAQLSAGQKCPGCKDGRITVVCKHPPATSHQAFATSFIWAECLFPLSVCVCIFGAIVLAHSCKSLLRGLLTLAVRYILTLWYGISHNAEWEDMETAAGEESKTRGEETPQR